MHFISMSMVVSGDDIVSSHVFRTLVAGDVNIIQLSRSAGTRKTWQQDSHPDILQQASKVAARGLKEDHHRQGLESDSSASNIPLEQQK